MSFMVIAVAMLAAFCLQFLFQMVQMKSFNKFYTKLRKKGRVAIGKAKGGFHAGAIVMFAIDQDGVIIDGCFMRGFTMLARFKNWDFFNGIDVGTIKKDDCATIGVSLRRAVLKCFLKLQHDYEWRRSLRKAESVYKNWRQDLRCQ